MTTASRPLFNVLLPGDVLVNHRDDNDTLLVLRAGPRLDFLDLKGGRFLQNWVFASTAIPRPYDVVRGLEVIIPRQVE